MKKLITSLLAAALLVSSVPALAETDKPKAAEQIYYNVYSSDWPSLNYMYESSADLCANFIDTLVEYDNYGILQPCLAESWECSEDGLTWTFHLRKGVKWMTADMEEYGADVVADDFVYSASRILDSSLTQVSKTSDILYVIKNAEAYFNGECDWEDVGVKAIDDYTLEYTLEQPVAYFESMLSYVCFMPCNREFGEEMGEDFGTSNYTYLYCGAYILTDWEPGAYRVLKRNPTYWDIDNIHIEELNETFNSEASTLSAELFKRGEIMTASLTASEAQTWLADPELSKMIRPGRAAFNYSYWYAFNYYIKAADGSYTYPEEYDPENYFLAAQNKNFRKSIFHALDRVAAMMTKVSDETSARSLMINTITPPGFATGAGEYTQTGSLAAISNTDSYNADLALEYKAKAVEELTAAGVTFPVKAPFFFVAGNTVAQDNATVLKQCFTDSFGDDFIQLDLGTYVSSLAKEVRIPKLHGFVINGWGADFGDPVNFVGQEILHDSNAYYAVNYSNIQLVAEDPADYQKELVDEFEQFTDLVNAANAIVDDTDARYEAFAKAEAYMINNSLAVPCYYDVRWCLTHVNEYTKINAMFGPCNFKYVNWETSEDAYTTAQYEEFAKAFDAAKS